MLPTTILSGIWKTKIRKCKGQSPLTLGTGPKGAIQRLLLVSGSCPLGKVSDFLHPTAFFHQVRSTWGLLVLSLPLSGSRPMPDENWCINPLAPSSLGLGNFEAYVLTPCVPKWVHTPAFTAQMGSIVNYFFTTFFLSHFPSILKFFLQSSFPKAPYTWRHIRSATKLSSWREEDMDIMKSPTWCTVPLKSEHQKKLRIPLLRLWS